MVWSFPNERFCLSLSLALAHLMSTLYFFQFEVEPHAEQSSGSSRDLFPEIAVVLEPEALQSLLNGGLVTTSGAAAGDDPPGTT